MYLDTGADVTVIGRRFLRRAWDKRIPVVKPDGRFPVQVSLDGGDRWIEVQTAVVERQEGDKPGNEDVLLGRDFLSGFVFVVDGPEQCFSLFDAQRANDPIARFIEALRGLKHP